MEGRVIKMTWYNVGKIVNTHGIRGEVRVMSSTDFKEERYRPGATLFLDDHRTELIVKSFRQHKQFDLLAFEGYETIESVQPFMNQTLQVHQSQLQDIPLNEGEYFSHDIIDCDVYSEQGEHIGKVTEILSPGANDVWVVRQRDGSDVLIPYIAPVVKQVDVDNKAITIHLMEGLLE